MPSTAKRSGNPAKRAAAAPQAEKKQYGKKVWGRQAANEDGTIDLELPSGELIKVKRLGVEGLIKTGVLHNVDSLTALVDEKHLKRVKGKKTDEIDPMSLMKDEKNLEQLFHTVDRVTSAVVVEPEVRMTPNDVTNRQAGDHVYCDEIPLEDRLYILNFVVGGTRDIEQFRRETQSVVGSVADGEGVSLPAE